MQRQHANKKRENINDKQVKYEENCYICLEPLEEIRLYGTKHYEQEIVYPICKECFWKITNLGRLLISDIDGNLFTKAWITKNSPYKKNKPNRDLERPINVKKLKDNGTTFN